MQLQKTEELYKLLRKQEAYHASCSHEEQLTLINHIIETTSKILIIEPDDHYARMQRMTMNAFPQIRNFQAIIEDATFIAENERIGMKCLVGYDWLVYAYTDLLEMRDTGIEMQEEQLLCLQRLAMSREDLDFKSGELLDKLAHLQIRNNQKEQAIKSWGLAFRHYPFTHNRNAEVGHTLLEMGKLKEAKPLVLRYHDWCYEVGNEGYQVPIVSELERLYKKGVLGDYPRLMAVLFHLIRNNKAAFGLVQKLSFYQIYLLKLEMAVIGYPRCSELWMAIGDTYFFDLKKYEKAYQAYFKCLEGTNPNRFYKIYERLKICIDKTRRDFFELPFSFEGEPMSLYNIMNTFSEFYSEDSQDVRFLEVGLKFGEAAFDIFNSYFIDGEGESTANLPDVFRATCNSYGIAIQRYNKHINKGAYGMELSEKAYHIHMTRFNHLQIAANIENAFACALEAGLYQECIDETKAYERSFFASVDLSDQQNCYYHKMAAYSKLGERTEMVAVYQKAKSLYLKICQGVVDAENKFIFVAKQYYDYEILTAIAFEKMIPELEWFLSTKVAERDEPSVVDLIRYYLDICKKHNEEKQ